jgi:hypothetical protein
MKFEIADVRCSKMAGVNDYLYVEHHLSHEDSVFGFSILLRSQDVLAALVDGQVMAGFDTTNLQPNTEIAGNTFYDVNSGAVASRYLGDIVFDFSVQKTNIITITPGMVLGGVTFPDPLPPIVGIQFRNAALRLTDVRITKRLGN